MKYIYPKLTVPLLFAFSACATNQAEKSVTSQSQVVMDDAKSSSDTAGHFEMVSNDTMDDTKKVIEQPSKNKNIDSSGKLLVATNLNSALPAPPHFENEEVNKGVQEFDAMIRENMIAEQNHDTAKMKVLKAQMNSLPTNIAIWIFNMSAEERTLFKAYLEKVENVAKAKSLSPK